MPHGLLLAAFPPELAGLDVTPPAGWTVALAGVGALSAAATTARLVAAHAPARVLFVGTCGAYDARLSPFDLLAVSEAIATSQDELLGRAYRPTIEPTRFRSTWPLPLDAHPVAVPPAITVDADGARALARLAPGEHLEATGVLAACAAAGVPAAVALAVANRVGPEASAEWKANHARASRLLVEALRAKGVLQ